MWKTAPLLDPYFSLDCDPWCKLTGCRESASFSDSCSVTRLKHARMLSTLTSPKCQSYLQKPQCNFNNCSSPSLAGSRSSSVNVWLRLQTSSTPVNPLLHCGHAFGDSGDCGVTLDLESEILGALVLQQP